MLLNGWFKVNDTGARPLTTRGDPSHDLATLERNFTTCPFGTKETKRTG